MSLMSKGLHGNIALRTLCRRYFTLYTAINVIKSHFLSGKKNRPVQFIKVLFFWITGKDHLEFKINRFIRLVFIVIDIDM